MKMCTSLQQFVFFSTLLVAANAQTMTMSAFVRVNYCGNSPDPVTNEANATVLQACQKLHGNGGIGGSCMDARVLLKNDEGLTNEFPVKIGICYNAQEYLDCVTDHPENALDMLVWEYKKSGKAQTVTCSPDRKEKGKGANKQSTTSTNDDGSGSSGNYIAPSIPVGGNFTYVGYPAK